MAKVNITGNNSVTIREMMRIAMESVDSLVLSDILIGAANGVMVPDKTVYVGVDEKPVKVFVYKTAGSTIFVDIQLIEPEVVQNDNIPVSGM